MATIHLLLFISAVMFIDCQNIYRNLKSQSPFQPPSDDVNQWITLKPGQKKIPDVAQSKNPVTMPTSTPATTTLRLTTTTRPSTTAESKIKNGIVKEETKEGSPFGPPIKTEWHKPDQFPDNSRFRPSPSPWLSSLEARQLHNADSIPAISNINVPKQVTSEETSDTTDSEPVHGDKRRPKPRGKRPKMTVYQDNSHRDMHDAGPGVTPWTRYTEKPRQQEDVGGGSAGRSNARCGWQRYAPRTQICCQGQVLRRQGIKPSCCGTEAYDTVFNKCCNGVLSFRSPQDPDC
ncbi:unnamed protein product [Lymnaea stagnalis]|uniref:Galaxin-like repeats domain-containing protein n=1 Tax=Lymnaea stagnalis TaxID=6523 RepID=A0AAV2HEL9_LYMST